MKQHALYLGYLIATLALLVLLWCAYYSYTHTSTKYFGEPTSTEAVFDDQSEHLLSNEHN